MANFIDKDKLVQELKDYYCIFPAMVKRAIENAPVITIDEDYAIQCTCYALGCQQAEQIEKKALEEFLKKVKEWLNQIAINNADCAFELSMACAEIISRLDGLKRFVEETRVE